MHADGERASNAANFLTPPWRCHILGLKHINTTAGEVLDGGAYGGRSFFAADVTGCYLENVPAPPKSSPRKAEPGHGCHSPPSAHLSPAPLAGVVAKRGGGSEQEAGGDG